MTRTATSYLKVMGWRTVANASQLRLPLFGGMVALSVPNNWGVRAWEYLRRIEQDGPTIFLPCDRRMLTFLADANDTVMIRDDMPEGAVLHRPPASILLPPSLIGTEVVRWLAPPNPARRWLPTAAGVLTALLNC